MHPLFFALKRAHLRTLQIETALLHDFGMTPARFDLMRVVFIHRRGVMQWRLRLLLGVSPATVSRMVMSLEKLGLLRREVSENDKRDRVVIATEAGRIRVDAALRALVDNLIAQRLALRAADLDPEAAHAKLAALQSLLGTMRAAYGDEARFNHPWSLAELDPYVRRFRAGFSNRPDDTRPGSEDDPYGGSRASAS